MFIESITIRKSPTILFFRMVIATFFIYTIFSIYSFFLYQESSIDFSFLFFNKSAFILASVTIEAFAMFLLFLQWSFFRYKVTDREIVEKKGLIKRQEDAHSLKNTQSVKIYQGYLGTVFNFGTLILHNPLSKQDIILKNIPDVQKYSKVFRRILESHTQDPETIIPKH